MTDVLTDIRSTEAVIRQTEAEVRQELADLMKRADTAQRDDVAAYAASLAAGDPVPQPTSSKIKERMRDIETRVLPGTDSALWELVAKVVEAAKPDVNGNILEKNLLRWQPPDPGRRDRPAPTRFLAHRPPDVVEWVLSRIAAVTKAEAEQRRKAEGEARHRAAERAVNAAQADYERDESIAYEEHLSRMSTTRRAEVEVENSKKKLAPWRAFDRRAFLEREGLLADYNWQQGGGHIEVKGNPAAVSAMHAPPARETAPATTSATEA